jgi:hypothetical protein
MKSGVLSSEIDTGPENPVRVHTGVSRARHIELTIAGPGVRAAAEVGLIEEENK